MKLKIKELREEKFKSQQEVADAIGLKIRTYQEIERGNNQASYENLIKLSRYFNRSIDYILDNIDEQNIYTTEEKLILQDFKKLPQADKTTIQTLIKSLIKE